MATVVVGPEELPLVVELELELELQAARETARTAVAEPRVRRRKAGFMNTSSWSENHSLP
jgi:hypothetical protein